MWSIDRSVIVLSCNFLMKNSWFELAELAFSRVWLVVHSTYGSRASALNTCFLRGMAGGVTLM